MTSNNTRKGFTLIELLVVVAMIATIVGSVSTSVSAAQERARVQRATAEVKAATQAILAYENYNPDKGLTTMENRDADTGSLGFLLGGANSELTGEKVPVLLAAALGAGGKWRDPWGTPYKVTIREGGATVKMDSSSGSLQTGFFFPNFYRLSEEERQ